MCGLGLGKLGRAGLLLVVATCSSWAAQSANLPTWEKVRQLVATELQREAGYQPGDLIVRSQVRAIFAQLKAIGWEVPRQSQIIDQTLDDGDFVAQTLRNSDGRGLMRQIQRYPQGYDRLDRLARMPHGQQNVAALVRGPDGYKLIQYMTSVQGGKSLGASLAKGPQGADFNRPTGRIYTAEALVARLRQSYPAPPGKTTAVLPSTGK